MECSATEAEVVMEELLEPLIITEDGDVAGAVPERDTTSSSAAASQRSCTDESALQQKEELLGGDEKKEAVESKTSSEEQLEKQQGETEDGHEPEAGELEGTGGINDGQNSESKEPSLKVTISHEEPRKTQEEKVAQDDCRVEIRRFHSSEQLPKEAESQEEDAKKLTPDFPEALFELLCTLQEGRRLNDQRCSFTLEEGVGRRRCHSEPNTRKPAHRVVFSSMTSLQKEEFFDLVATAQARRLDDQRAHLGKSAAPKPKCRSFRGSLKQLSVVRKPEPVPVPVPKEALYDMILTTQAQGRLEDQRSRAPGPMDDDDFFSLLLRVQGGRMEEQRTELPRLLQT
uniref:G-protein signaling modulator 3 n=1 Tax=Nothobranchius korthausae TaxID=1143690 RepID=A0A1A8FUA0_9TELE